MKRGSPVLQGGEEVRALDTDALKACWEETRGFHPARRFLELARTCHPEHVMRMEWRQHSNAYSTCTVAEADEWLSSTGVEAERRRKSRDGYGRGRDDDEPRSPRLGLR